MSVKQISAIELKNRIQKGDKLFLLDVREPNEFQYAHIDNSVLIPLNQLPKRLNELDAQQETVVICHHGMRSQQAAAYLEHSGFNAIANLTGGIDAWSCECDSSVPRY
ncbi:Rhodanese domain-containing protein [Candidatus Methylobacter favarea]|uniref:Rhodanese domain-containing protein n=1 Tax=Candidatus Methylobacter favarea TaxID=2707345 RepID=A0A8S0WYE7_9GAMM|nr:rhodanese-like domain-containing protein [Candidatus Methylobacter favarea]CAA9889523.1 Rhodanese domain-containing protein [Candidatus Methylobacter favarea]